MTVRTTYLEVFTRESMQAPRWFGIDRDGKFVIKTDGGPDRRVSGGDDTPARYALDLA